VKPGSKEGLWVVEVRDEKTNKMVQPPREDSAENWNTYAYGHGNPEAAYKHLLDLDAAAAAKKDKAADATLAHERAKELKTLDPGKTSTLGQLITDRDKAIALHGPKHPDVLAFIKAIKKAETASGGLQVSFGSMGTITTDDEGNVVAGQVGKDGRPRVTRLGIVDPKVLAQDKAIKVAKDKIANLVKEGAGRYSDRATGTRVFPDDATLKLSEMEYTTKEYKDQYDPKPGLKPKP
jgi:ribosomal protein S16